jgi:hypothetical protein
MTLFSSGLCGDVLRLSLGLLALLSAVHKLLEPARTRAAAIALLGGGSALGTAGWGLAAAAELSGAALLLTGRGVLPGAALLGGLWSTYGAALAVAARHRRLEDCGCSFGRRRVPPGFAVTRNLLLAGSAGALALGGAGEAAPLAFSLPAALAFLCLYLAAEAVGATTPTPRSHA